MTAKNWPWNSTVSSEKSPDRGLGKWKCVAGRNTHQIGIKVHCYKNRKWARERSTAGVSSQCCAVYRNRRASNEVPEVVQVPTLLFSNYVWHNSILIKPPISVSKYSLLNLCFYTYFPDPAPHSSLWRHQYFQQIMLKSGKVFRVLFLEASKYFCLPLEGKGLNCKLLLLSFSCACH